VVLYVYVLVLAGIELIFFIVANTKPSFGFVLKTVLIMHMKLGEEERRKGMFRVMVFVFPSNCYA